MKLEDIEALCRAATPGPWDLVELTNHNAKSPDRGKKYLAVKQGEHFLDEDMPDADAAFIAASRTLLPKLVELWTAVSLAAEVDFPLTVRIRKALAALEDGHE